MLFLLLKNDKDSKLAESSCLTLALATHTKKIKSFDGKRGGSHEMLISDVCHNYQFKKVIFINVTHITPEEAVYLLKNLFLCIKGIQHSNYMNNSNK